LTVLIFPIDSSVFLAAMLSGHAHWERSINAAPGKGNGLRRNNNDGATPGTSPAKIDLIPNLDFYGT